MPTMYIGKKYGEVIVDEYYEIDYGPLGITRVGVKWPAEDAEEKKKNRARLMDIAELVVRRQMEEEMEE